MKNKKELKSLIVIFAVAIILYPLLPFVNECIAVSQVNHCLGRHTFGAVFGAFLANILCVFLAMLLWFISPIGILFLLGIKMFFCENTSKLKRHFAVLIQFLAFLAWSSLMFILIIAYIDSISYQIINVGGNTLNLAIKSGLGFMIFMVMLALAENKILNEQNSRSESVKKKKTDPKQNRKGKNNDESVKIAGTRGIKNKVKNRIKKEVKKAINDKIDKL
ncbi:MAG: hypothetical protein KAJ14_01300 [Candidatus Omnitrophica bacterium]|nr:hypothetical protein [Candidatus Omnitrophota bacterium]